MDAKFVTDGRNTDGTQNSSGIILDILIFGLVKIIYHLVVCHKLSPYNAHIIVVVYDLLEKIKSLFGGRKLLRISRDIDSSLQQLWVVPFLKQAGLILESLCF